MGFSEPAYGQTFGPANRPSYDANEWAIVPRGNAYATEILPDPDAVDRKRKEEEPAFLKPSVKENRLASILTIYHEIPLAREVFLNKEKLASDYGSNPEWWTGAKIEANSPNWTGEASWNTPTQEVVENFLIEIQRLMAFLTGTERAYGSADALAAQKALEYQGSVDVESKFFDAWKDACVKMGQADLIKLLYSTAVQPNAAETWAPESNHFAVLDLQIPFSDSKTSEEATIYDLADEILWQRSGFDMNNSAYLDSLGEVIAFRFASIPNSEARIRVPAIWWPDRYLKEHREEVLKMRLKQADITREISKINMKEQKLTHFTLSSGKVVRVKDLFAASMRHDENIITHSQDEKAYSPNSETNISKELEQVMKSIDAKLQRKIFRLTSTSQSSLTYCVELEKEKEAAHRALRELSNLYTSPSEDASAPPTHKYTLRGVSVSKFITYINRRAEPNLISMSEDSDMNGQDQWWMIEYSTSSSNPVNIRKVTEEEVLQEAYSESSKAIVIYASEKALQKRDTVLPPALQRFVDLDNEAFRMELLGNDGDNETMHVEHREHGMDSSMEVMDGEWPNMGNTRNTSPKRKFERDGNGEERLMVRWEDGASVPPPPSGPPPAYSPPVNGEWGVGDDKNGLGEFPSPPTYNTADGKAAAWGVEKSGFRVLEDEKEEMTMRGGELGEGQGQEMKEMTTKGDVPRLISTMSMDVREGNVKEDSMDVDDLQSSGLPRN